MPSASYEYVRYAAAFVTRVQFARRRVRQLAAFSLLGVLSAVAPGTAKASVPGGASASPSTAVKRVGTLTGVVVDQTTGLPLAAARVRIVGVGREETTHDDGTFSFDAVPDGTHTLVVQRIGYRPSTLPVTVTAIGSEPVRVEMRVSAIELSTVVVTGTLGERLSGDVLSPTAVLSGAELDRQVGGTVASTLRDQPGVSVTSIGPATARPVIRGMGGDRILVLEDGLRPGDLSSTSGDHALAIEPLTARQFEVVRGPMSLLYGPNALGGVVNVIRDEVPTTRPDQPHGVASLVGSTVNSGLSAAASGIAGLGALAVRGEASVRDAGNLRTPAGTLPNTALRTYSMSTGASLVESWGHVGGAYRFYDNSYGIPGGFVGSHPTGVDIEMRRHMLRTEAERREVGPFSSVDASAAYTNYEHDEVTPSGGIGTSFAQDLVAFDAIARHDHAGVFSQGAVGFRAQYRNIATGGSLRTPSTYDYSVAGFLVEEWEQGPFRLQGGARYDWARYVPRDPDAFVEVNDEQIPALPRNFGSFSASLGGLVDAGAGVQLGASVARAYRTPDFNELYSDGPHLAANSYDVGDPRLGQETGIGLDAFVRFSNDNVRGEVAAFRNSLSGYIYPRNTGELGRQGGRFKFQYSGRDALLTGAEADASWSVTDQVVLDGTVSYVRGTLVGRRDSLPEEPALGLPARPGSEYLPFIPPLNGRVAVRYEQPRYFAGAGVRMAARQDDLGDFEEATDGYNVVDLSAGVRLLFGGRLHTLTLRLDNVADREYRNHLSRTKEIMPEAGRNVSLLYRFVF